MADPLDALATLYADLPGVVRRGGLVYPVAVRSLPDGARVVVAADPVVVDPDLRAAGEAHLAAVRAASGAHDGKVLCLSSVAAGTDPAVPGPAAQDPTVVAGRGGYFDMLATCDVLAGELDAAGPAATWDDLPLRRRVHDLAGDPFLAGHGRAAAFGVSVLLVVRTPDGPGVVVGRRSARVAAGRGRWHVAPSGMLEEARDGRHVATTVATELREELGVVRSVGAVGAGLRVVGLATDLERLRPDLVVVLDLDRDLEGAGRPDGAALVAGPEFDELEVVPLTPAGFAAFWAARPPSAVTPPGAGALALLEGGLAGFGA